MTVEIGFGLITCQRFPGEKRSNVELYADALELAVEAEVAGFDSVWVSEHHFVDDGYLPSLLPFCAAIAARTSRVRIGTGLLLAPLIEPIRLAEDVAVTDLLAGGRLLLGLGLGWREEEFDALGVPLRERAARLEDAVAVCRRAWVGEPLNRRARVHDTDMYVTPLPARSGGPPIWIGGLSQVAARRAGRIADGFMATEVTPSSFAQQVDWVREAASGAGRDPGSLAISVHLPTFVHDGNSDVGWAEVLPCYRYVEWKYQDMETAHSRPPGSPSPPFIDAETEVALRRGIVFGTGQEVADQIVSFADAAGGDLHFIARLYWPGMPSDRQHEAVRRFAEGVIPRVR